MRGSLKLFTWFGIPVYLHWSFSLIFLYALGIGLYNNLSPLSILWLMGFFVCLFGCVLLHEYGHSLTARQFEVETRDIVLTPIGGIARLERMPEKPAQELWVAIAGPAVNIAIATVLLALGWLIFRNENWSIFKMLFEQQFPSVFGSEGADELDDVGLQPVGLLFYLPALLAANIWLVLFNMIPAFPMDGGRVFRALLSMRLGRLRGTRLASAVGQFIAVLFVILGLWKGQYPLAFIGVFVFMMARTENAMVQLDDLFRRFKAADVARSVFTRLSANDWMQTPIEMFEKSPEQNFLVFDLTDRPVGALSKSRIQEAAKARDLTAEISRYMHPLELVHQTESLQYIYFLLRQAGHSILGVSDGSEVVGVIDEDALKTFLRTKGIR